MFWACGVTPQVVVEASKPPFSISHGPGAMLVTDLLNSVMTSMGVQGGDDEGLEPEPMSLIAYEIASVTASP